jgi:hypothetical protein
MVFFQNWATMGRIVREIIHRHVLAVIITCFDNWQFILTIINQIQHRSHGVQVEPLWMHSLLEYHHCNLQFAPLLDHPVVPKQRYLLYLLKSHKIWNTNYHMAQISLRLASWRKIQLPPFQVTLAQEPKFYHQDQLRLIHIYIIQRHMERSTRLGNGYLFWHHNIFLKGLLINRNQARLTHELVIHKYLTPG